MNTLLATRLSEILACPNCHARVDFTGREWHCEGCGRSYVDADGIPCFTETDPFYDRYSDVHCPFTPSPKGVRRAILATLPFWSYREWRFWRKVIPTGGRLLDLGSGRGKEVFMERAAETVGLDGSLSFLRGCREHYDEAVLASLPRLPFRDGTFDAVVSSHVIGHIAFDDKDHLIGDIARVLRPGGVSAHIVEVSSTHPIMERARRDPGLYQRHIIDQDGHIGLEPASKLVDRFARAGLRLEVMRLVDAIVPSAMYFDKYLDHDGYRDLPGTGPTRALRRIDAAGPVGNLIYEFGFGTFHRTFEQWFGRPERANFVHVAFRKA